MARTRDRLGLGLVVVIAGTVLSGWLFHEMTGLDSRDPAPAGSVPVPRETVAAAAEDPRFDAHFRGAVALMRQGRYEEAHRMVTAAGKLRPHIPEVHVNTGFVLLALGYANESAAAFAKALELRPMQVNAYYGMAESLEMLGDLPGALGSMRTFVHLAAADDRFRRRAEAAIWEWEAALAGQRARPADPADTEVARP